MILNLGLLGVCKAPNAKIAERRVRGIVSFD
jgi:hypothetical protein